VVNGCNWNAEFYKGKAYVLHSSNNCERKWHYAQYNKQHLENEGMKKRIHTEESLNEQTCIVTG
jgi:hypothetical protein